MWVSGGVLSHSLGLLGWGPGGNGDASSSPLVSLSVLKNVCEDHPNPLKEGALQIRLSCQHLRYSNRSPAVQSRL
ncbi:hypothetical protein NE237_014186 [Protea cynaroides]|uniref:Uncharacterized protein n=1 Tax=Protea cynaroides TaxID=273540 RepID=A0A9Q0GN18_9MAGN|nr:hypothetical protein NE237_014186 [Protea cynaroides]